MTLTRRTPIKVNTTEIRAFLNAGISVPRDKIEALCNELDVFRSQQQSERERVEKRRLDAMTARQVKRDRKGQANG